MTRLVRHCTTSLKVAGSIPDVVIGIFQLHSFGRTVALGSTQPLNRNGVVVSCVDPVRNVSWILFPGGTELVTQVKKGSPADRTHSQ